MWLVSGQGSLGLLSCYQWGELPSPQLDPVYLGPAGAVQQEVITLILQIPGHTTQTMECPKAVHIPVPLTA